MEASPSSGAHSDDTLISLTGTNLQKMEDDPQVLLNSNYPGMVLVTLHLTGSNYLTQSIAIRTALEAKDKVGFIDGSFVAPTDVDAFKKWKRVDFMINQVQDRKFYLKGYILLIQ